MATKKKSSLGRGGMYWVPQIVRGREEDAMSDRQIRDLITENYKRIVKPAFPLSAAVKYGLKLHHTRIGDDEYARRKAVGYGPAMDVLAGIRKFNEYTLAKQIGSGKSAAEVEKLGRELNQLLRK